MATDFSIRSILGQHPDGEFEWLRCSRYKPPKLSRPKKKNSRRRETGRTPRIPFTTGQLMALEKRYQANPYLNSDEVAHLSSLLRLSDVRVKVWFQNRRARERRVRGLQEIFPNKREIKHVSVPPVASIRSAFRPVQPTADQFSTTNRSTTVQRNDNHILLQANNKLFTE